MFAVHFLEIWYFPRNMFENLLNRRVFRGWWVNLSQAMYSYRSPSDNFEFCLWRVDSVLCSRSSSFVKWLLTARSSISTTLFDALSMRDILSFIYPLKAMIEPKLEKSFLLRVWRLPSCVLVYGMIGKANRLQGFGELANIFNEFCGHLVEPPLPDLKRFAFILTFLLCKQLRGGSLRQFS